jgi:hypothetical protein
VNPVVANGATSNGVGRCDEPGAAMVRHNAGDRYGPDGRLKTPERTSPFTERETL